MTKQQIGVVGLAVMGRNLALNIESRGYSVAVYNRSFEKTEEFLADEAAGKNFFGAEELEEFVQTLETPRKIILMVKAGAATDKVIESLQPYLEKGDILIDGGNTLFEETMRRNKVLDETGIHFIGTGISGGEEGALKGPSIMPGGQREAYELVAPILEAISAKADDGEPCVTYVGPNGAGHYVKMVHNGIEYGDMQLIAEAYDILKNAFQMDANELHEVFADWNKGELDSYLIDITADIFTKVDEKTGKPTVDIIMDKAGQKGTGKWTSKNALDLGVPLPLITESVFARYISSLKEERVVASSKLSGPDMQPYTGDRAELIEAVRKALYMSKIISYTQGFAQLRAASEEYKWDIQFGDIAMIWRAGCIISASFLQKIKEAYDRTPDLQNLILDPYFKDVVDNYQSALRDVVALAVKNGIPVPTFSSAIAYYDSYRTADLPANLIQAQRDYFGAHTYQRKDMEGTYHTKWF